MNSIRQMIFSGWHLMRIVRLVLGVFITINAITMHDTISGLLAGIFLYQAITNTGCCCATSCAIPSSANKQKTETIFEEIKND